MNVDKDDLVMSNLPKPLEEAGPGGRETGVTMVLKLVSAAETG